MAIIKIFSNGLGIKEFKLIKKYIPKVSVIIPTYNRVDLLARTIESVFWQTHQNLEVIIVDDGSNDGTELLIERLKENFNEKIQYFHQNRLGACEARNKGMEIATGDYIQFLDSDDYLTKEKIKTQVDAMEKDGTPCAICDFEYIDDKGNILKSIVNNGNIYSYVASLRSTSIMAPLIRATSIRSELKWNKYLKRNQDIDFIFKYFMTINSWSYTPGFFCKYVMHDGPRISGDYHKGMQYLMLYRSMHDFIKYSNNKITIDNKLILAQYRNNLFKLYLRHKIKKILKMAQAWFFVSWIRSKLYKNV